MFAKNLLLNLLMSAFDSMFEETAKVRVSCCHLIIQRWGGFLLLPSPGSGSHVQTHEGLVSSGSSPNREGGRALECGRQIVHLRSHAIIDGGSSRDPVFHRGRGGSLRLESCGFLAFSAHHVIGYVPAGQRGRVRLNSGRPELSVNKVSG